MLSYGMEQIVGSKEPANLSSGLIAMAGKRLGLTSETINELIKPQNVNVFRLPLEVLGKTINIWGCIVLHNNARGPYKGGVRLAPDVDIWETTELARLMTLKTAVSGIEFGGGKSGFRVNMQELYKHFGILKRSDEFEKMVKKAIFKEFTAKFRPLFQSHEYVPAPDMGTSGNEMTEIYNSTGDPASVTGKPEGVHGWLPGRKESTGYGVAVSTVIALNYYGIDPSKAEATVQGFGNVGSYSAYYLSKFGVKITAVTDINGGVYNKEGLDIEKLFKHAKQQGTVVGFPGTTSITNDDLFSIKTDALVLAAAGHVINQRTAKLLNTRFVISGANMPITQDGMPILDEKNIFVFPDVIANVGGVIASGLEYSSSLSAMHSSKEQVLAFVKERITESFDQSIDISKQENINLTEAATVLAVKRIKDAMVLRGWLTGTSCDIQELTAR